GRDGFGSRVVPTADNPVEDTADHVVALQGRADQLHIGGRDRAVDVERSAVQQDEAGQIGGYAAGEAAAAAQEDRAGLSVQYAGHWIDRDAVETRVAAGAAGFAERPGVVERRAVAAEIVLEALVRLRVPHPVVVNDRAGRAATHDSSVAPRHDTVVGDGA